MENDQPTRAELPPINFRQKSIMHGTTQTGGSIHIFNLIDFPEVVICDFKDGRTGPWTRTISFCDIEFETVEDAIEAVKHRDSKFP